ncbi:MAG: S-layer homology domain-containing protein [Desulfotomaculaceae bacterium]|nr:S-layer homology domain-containing protein [Desulfotomaculaceae bacterium]
MDLKGIVVRSTAVCLALSLIIGLPGTARSEVLVPDLDLENAARSELSESAVKLDAGGQQTAVSLEQAIKIAKEALTVPVDFDHFDTGFEQSEKNSFWELRWYRTGDPGGSMDVRVNAESGEIWRMYKWAPVEPGQEYRGLPKYSREQAEIYAATFVEKVQPERYKLTKLQPDRGQDYIPLLFEKRGQVEYRYNYARIIEGIPYTENGINVTVSGDTGEVVNFEVNWDNTQVFPPAAGHIAAAQAEQIFRTESSPTLFYFRPQVPGGREVPLKLVYRLPGLQDRVLIDALTGKLLNQEYELSGYYGMGGSADMRMANAKQMADELSPAEEAAVKETEDLLAMDKAFELAKSLVKITQGYTLNSSRLEQDYMFKEKRTWHFNWQTGDEADRKWLDVSVDASTGELVSFSSNSNSVKLETPEVKISEEAARQKAEDFIKKAQPDKWEQVLFSNSRPELGPVLSPSEKPLPRSYTFEWSRVVKDIRFPQNGFFVSVDSSTGEIINYRMNWWDVDFPEPQGVISVEGAADKHLQQVPLELEYVRIWPRDEWMGAQKAKVHLVYIMSLRNFAMLDAFTGQPLSHEGKAVEATGAEVKFADLEGHPAREAIEQLARAKIVTGEDGKFRPADTVTQAELITMLVKSGTSRYDTVYRMGAQSEKEPWYQAYYRVAERMGIIQAGEQPDSGAAVTRECLSRLTVNTMGLSKVAGLSDIYLLDFKDAGEISAHLRGHAAIAAGLGLIEPIDGSFYPREVVTRAEAAVTLFKMLNND